MEPALCGKCSPLSFRSVGVKKTKLWKLGLDMVLIFSANDPVT